MRVPILLLAAILASSPAVLVRAQCAEPSALDLDPGAEPLRVEKAAGGRLRISWESVPADGYRLHQGRLDRLWSGSYDHHVVAEAVAAEVELSAGAGDAYFLVNSDCRASDSGVGRDSRGDPRPYGGLLVVAVGLQGGAGVYGSQFLLRYPTGPDFLELLDTAFLGPFAPGAPGSPFGIVNGATPGEMRAAVLFGTFMPDPSFDPPPDAPVDILEATFAYHGVPPEAAVFAAGDCSSTDNRGNPLPQVACLLSGYEVLF